MDDTNKIRGIACIFERDGNMLSVGFSSIEPGKPVTENLALSRSHLVVRRKDGTEEPYSGHSTSMEVDYYPESGKLVHIVDIQ